MNPIRPYRGVVPRLGARVYVDPAAVVIGDIVLGDDASIWPCAVARGDVHHVRIGARTNVQDGTVIHTNGEGTFIGDDCVIGHQAFLEEAADDERQRQGHCALE